MSIQVMPTSNLDYVEFVRSFQPSGSQTVVWARDMATGQNVYMLKWGNKIYFPVYNNMKIGLMVYNGRNVMVGYPAYVEAINLWLGGPAQPEDVGPDHMWEIRPGSTTKFDAFIDPYGSQGRPLIVTPSGFGNTAGESTLGTQQYRGQFRIYEKLQLGGGYQSTRRANQGTTRGSGGVLGVGGGAPEVFRGGGAKGFGSAGTLSANEGGLESYSGSPEIMNTGRAGIGAGAEETREHFDTGYQYQRNAQPVISVQIEYRQDLQNMLDNAWGAGWGNWWFDELSGNWWEDTSWQWRPRRRVAPQMPVIRPHRPPYGG